MSASVTPDLLWMLTRANEKNSGSKGRIGRLVRLCVSWSGDLKGGWRGGQSSRDSACAIIDFQVDRLARRMFPTAAEQHWIGQCPGWVGRQCWEFHGPRGDRNSFLVKRDGGRTQFCKEQFNLKNQNSFKFSGIANSKGCDLQPTENGAILTIKSQKGKTKPVSTTQTIQRCGAMWPGIGSCHRSGHVPCGPNTAQREQGKRQLIRTRLLGAGSAVQGDQDGPGGGALRQRLHQGDPSLLKEKPQSQCSVHSDCD
eukprot:3813880-Rhodomonas_salina.1